MTPSHPNWIAKCAEEIIQRLHEPIDPERHPDDDNNMIEAIIAKWVPGEQPSTGKEGDVKMEDMSPTRKDLTHPESQPVSRGEISPPNELTQIEQEIAEEAVAKIGFQLRINQGVTIGAFTSGDIEAIILSAIQKAKAAHSEALKIARDVLINLKMECRKLDANTDTIVDYWIEPALTALDATVERGE